MKKDPVMEILRSNGLNLSRFVKIVKKQLPPGPVLIDRFAPIRSDLTIRYDHIRIDSDRLIGSDTIRPDTTVSIGPY